MTVGELQELLDSMPPDAEIRCYGADGERVVEVVLIGLEQAADDPVVMLQGDIISDIG